MDSFGEYNVEALNVALSDSLQRGAVLPYINGHIAIAASVPGREDNRDAVYLSPAQIIQLIGLETPTYVTLKPTRFSRNGNLVVVPEYNNITYDGSWQSRKQSGKPSKKYYKPHTFYGAS